MGASFLWLLWSVPAPGWVAAESPRFSVYAQARDLDIRLALNQLERSADLLERMGLGPLRGPKLRIIAFDSPEEYAPFRLTPWSAAHYVYDGREEIIVSGRLDPRLLAHELVHAAIRRSGRDWPLWWEEGFAEWFGGIRFEREWAILGEAPSARITALHRDGLLSPGQLETLGPDLDHARRFYRTGWALANWVAMSGVYSPPRDESLPGIIANLSRAVAKKQFPVWRIAAPIAGVNIKTSETTAARIYSSLQAPRTSSVSAAM